MNPPKPHVSFVPMFQVSGLPFVTSSDVPLGQTNEIDFQWVSRFFTVKNNTPDALLAVGFTANGLKPENGNFFILSGAESFEAEMRVNKLFLSCSSGSVANATVIGGLTLIEGSLLTFVTASSTWPGVG